jgi:hypothetical protein
VTRAVIFQPGRLPHDAFSRRTFSADEVAFNRNKMFDRVGAMQLAEAL